MRVGIFGNFGWGNLGNSATLEAAVAGVHRCWPQASILCICTNPPAVRRQYGLDVAPVRWEAGESLPLPAGRAARTAVKLLRRPPAEIQLWRRAHEVVKQLDLLMVAGTGVLDDFAISPLDLPYDLFKWSVQAHRRCVPLVYLSTGAGPIDHRRSRLLIKTALRQALYRSFRDEYSRSYLEGIGFDAAQDPVYPDLAFGLPVPAALLTPAAPPAGTRQPVVGLGIMSYRGSHTSPGEGEAIYQAYLAKVVDFGAQLLTAGCTVRLLLGDTLVDQRAFADVGGALRAVAAEQGAPDRLAAEPMHTVDDLLRQLAQTDLVVATRFHNVLLALLLEKPVLSISYNQKNDDLMAEMGLKPFCQPIGRLDVGLLCAQFADLQANAGAIRQQVAQQNRRQRQRLDEQYARVAELVSRYSPPRHP